MNNQEIKIDKVVEAVKADLTKRSELGIEKYGLTLEDNRLSLGSSMQHAYEEVLDLVNYLKKSLMSLEPNENVTMGYFVQNNLYLILDVTRESDACIKGLKNLNDDNRGVKVVYRENGPNKLITLSIQLKSK